jgi:hypothetical protein
MDIGSGGLERGAYLGLLRDAERGAVQRHETTAPDCRPPLRRDARQGEGMTFLLGLVIGVILFLLIKTPVVGGLMWLSDAAEEFWYWVFDKCESKRSKEARRRNDEARAALLDQWLLSSLEIAKDNLKAKG